MTEEILAGRLAGKEVAANIKKRSGEAVLQLTEKGVIPTLGIIRIGEKEDDIAYERNACKRCESLEISVRRHAFKSGVTQEELTKAITALNHDSSIHGILLLRPLPGHIDENTVRNAVAVEKDVDGITDGSIARVFTSVGSGFSPCTAQACMEILEYYGYDLKGKRVVVIGRSLVVGKPVSMLLLEKHATVTICHTKTANLPAETQSADIVIVAAGKPKAVGAEYFRKGQTVIDVGINVDEKGNLCGDVDFEAVEPIVGAITPVPGGVGTVTTSVLAEHVIRAAQRSLDMLT